jgi:Kef-type K+ transport system membrane component KefB
VRITPRLAGTESDEARIPSSPSPSSSVSGSPRWRQHPDGGDHRRLLAGILFAETEQAEQLRDSMRPIYQLLVPIFFIFMGLRWIRRLTGWAACGGALLIIAVAIAGKLAACGLARCPWGEALAIGIGMVPAARSASWWRSPGRAGIVTGYLYDAIILMSVVTSIVAPPFLRLALARQPEQAP